MHHRFAFAFAAPSLATLVLVLAVSPVAHAASRPHRAAVTTPHAAPMRAGMVIGIDPETGLIGPPTPQQMERLGAARVQSQSASAARPAPVYHAGGRISLDVRSWMREYSIVRIGADGKPARVCVSGRDAATEALHQTPVTPAAEDR